MNIIEQNFEILSVPENALQMIEAAGRTCYKSEDKITEDSAAKFVAMLIKRGHHAMIEFGDITVRIITNRGITHELVRHRLCSFAQESTRYVKYDNNMEFIKPEWWDESTLEQQKIWKNSISHAENSYIALLTAGWSPQKAREVLPNSLKTEIVIKGNIREWRHIFGLRCDTTAHPQMYPLMRSLLKELQEKVPVVFDDLSYPE